MKGSTSIITYTHLDQADVEGTLSDSPLRIALVRLNSPYKPQQ